MQANPAFANCFVYIRCLGTKRVLCWSNREEQEASLLSLASVIDLAAGVNHSVDTCTEIMSHGHAVFAKLVPLREACTRWGLRDPKMYRIFSLTRLGNLQASADDEQISSINCYTSYLGNLRAAGVEPTAALHPTAIRLDLAKGGPLEQPLIDKTIQNAAVVLQLQTPLRQLRTATFPLRIEFTSVLADLHACLTLQEEFLFDEHDVNTGNVVFVPVAPLIDYVVAILRQAGTRMSALALSIRQLDAAQQDEVCKQVRELALLEELCYDSLLYGRTKSALLTQILATSMDAGSEVLQLGVLQRQLQLTDGSVSFNEYLPQTPTRAFPLYLKTAYESITKLLRSAPPNVKEDADGCKTLAKSLAHIIVRTLDTEVRIFYAARLAKETVSATCNPTFCKLHDAVIFLDSSLRRRDRRGNAKFKEHKTPQDTAKKIHTTFFIARDMKELHFNHVHNFAMNK